MKTFIKSTYILGGLLLIALLMQGYVVLIQSTVESRQITIDTRNEFRIVCEYLGNVHIKHGTCLTPDEVHTRAAQLGIKPAWEEYE